MLCYSINLFIIIIFVKRFLVCASFQNHYKDYRLYLVQMSSNYELANSESISSLLDNNEQNGNDLDKLKTNEKKLIHPDSNDIFFSLMNQLVYHVPIDFWQLKINYSLFTVSPEYYIQVEDYLLNNSLKFDLVDENIQNRLNKMQNNIDGTVFFNTRNLDAKSFKLDTYHTLEEINDYLIYLGEKYPDTVQINSIGQTFEKRDILAITIKKQSKFRRPSVVIDAGIHAREWITHASALVIITKLVYYFNINYNHTVFDELAFIYNQTEADMVTFIDWTIIPVLNPDGYLHTWYNDRLYRKNRAVPKTKPRRAPWNFFSECIGTDLNRNFEYYFAYSAQSTNPCSDRFAGDSAFSESESSALRNLLLILRPQAYLSLHSFSQLITFPNQINRINLPNYRQLKEVAKRISLAIKESDGKEYQYGQTSQFYYGRNGDSVGWANLNGINLTYRIDLRDKGTFGYTIPKSEIMPNGEEIFKGLIVVADEIRQSFKSY